MSEQAFEILLGSLWALAAAGMAWYGLTIGRQITYVTLADGRRQERRLPVVFRLLLPLAPNLQPLFAVGMFEGMRKRAHRRLVSAGFEGVLHATEYLSLMVLMPVVLGPLWAFLVYGALHHVTARVVIAMRPFLLGMGPVYFAFYPALWLSQAVRRRHRQIERALPFLLDLLTLSVEAGMGFLAALQRHVEGGHPDALGEELVRVVREIQLGKARRTALRDMSRRVDLPVLRSVVNALVQADELGVSMGTILRIQSGQIRQRRFDRAEKLANEAPVKMLAPLLLFIFPAVFLILLGPVIAQLLRQGL